MRRFRLPVLNAILALAALATPAAAQFSDSYNFLKAVKERDGDKATELTNSGAASIINAKDAGSGDTALHIVTRRRDTTWMNFMLSKGANVEARNAEGTTALLVAAQLGFVDGAEILLARRARVDATNNRGESALILAVHNRDLAMARTLLAAGADPRQQDRIAGRSARDYAEQDGRSAAILKLMDEAKPKAPSRGVAGPRL